MSAREQFEVWMKDPYFDDGTKAELSAITDDEKEIEDRFYKDLEFGTAGLRGIIGAGSNRMNKYTVRKATQGLADYIISCGGQKRGVAIAYDSRHFSPEFADESALTLAANGIKAYVFESLRPTPVLSFAVRQLNAIAGINITASHNPPSYNGYKVYWEDGAQITPPHDKAIIEKVNAITDYSKAKTMPKEDAVKAGLYEVIGEAIDDAYDKIILSLVKDKKAIKEQASAINIVYTPLHGTGNKPVRRVLKKLGFENVFVVPEQEEPDGNFPTASYPNPETKEAFALGLALAKEKNADLVLATDPDADRLGVYVRDKEGQYHDLNGNMSGCLIGDYILKMKKETEGALPSDGAFIKSIVSTRLCDAIAKSYGVKLVEVLTGFKYIGGKMLEYETKGTGKYLFGMEESYGCLPADYARDKDAVAASVILCEAAAHYRAQGDTLWDAMQKLYKKLGYYIEDVISVELSGIEGAEKIQSIMKTLREDPMKKIADYDVLALRDYQADSRTDLSDGSVTPIGLPASNVLYYELSKDSWVCVRPSGTEPKIKFYYGVRGETENEAKAASGGIKTQLSAMIDGLK